MLQCFNASMLQCFKDMEKKIGIPKQVDIPTRQNNTVTTTTTTTTKTTQIFYFTVAS